MPGPAFKPALGKPKHAAVPTSLLALLLSLLLPLQPMLALPLHCCCAPAPLARQQLPSAGHPTLPPPLSCRSWPAGSHPHSRPRPARVPCELPGQPAGVAVPPWYSRPRCALQGPLKELVKINVMHGWACSARTQACSAHRAPAATGAGPPASAPPPRVPGRLPLPRCAPAALPTCSQHAQHAHSSVPSTCTAHPCNPRCRTAAARAARAPPQGAARLGSWLRPAPCALRASAPAARAARGWVTGVGGV